MNPVAKELLYESRHDFDSLVRVMDLLRAPDGCPWDREQTHESIRANFIEETYEVIEAIDTADSALLREELGDVLLQVVFHACMSREAGEFSIDDVVHDITEKLIRRHPHVFADVDADTPEKVLANWEQIKTEEKQRIGLAGSLASVPPSLPALMRAQKLVKKAAKAGIVPDKKELADAIKETSAALSEALRVSDTDEIKRLSGKLSFYTAAAAQLSDADAEEELSKECKAFTDNLTKKEISLGDFTVLDEQKRVDLAQSAYFHSKKFHIL